MTRVSRQLVLAVLLLGASAISSWADASAPRSTELQRFDALYDRRNFDGVLEELIVVAQQSLKTNPDSYDVTWRLARAWSWRGYVSDDSIERRTSAENALALGQRAMALGPTRVEGYFTYAIASGVYANAIGVTQAFVRRVGPDFERTMRRAVEIDRHFDGGSPMVALGRYYYELPWPLRDLQQSTHLLEEATRSHPASVRGHLYLAETYYALSRRSDARRELDAVLSTTSTDAGAAAMVHTARVRAREWYGDELLTAASDE